MFPALGPRLAFVDVETTGGSPARERVTEVGVVRVDFDGDDVRVDEWSTLVNPGMPIPAEIQWLTGITNEMVRAAPPFAEIAQLIFDRLEGAIFRRAQRALRLRLPARRVSSRRLVIQRQDFVHCAAQSLFVSGQGAAHP